MRKTIIILAAIIAAVSCSSGDAGHTVSETVLPEKLSYPDWLEGDWYEKNPDYILCSAHDGDITAPQAENRSLIISAREYEEYLLDFTETITDSIYEIRFTVDKDSGEPLYLEVFYEFTELTDCTVRLKERHLSVSGTAVSDTEPDPIVLNRIANSCNMQK